MKMKEEKTSQVQAKVGSQVEVNELSMHYHSKDVERGKDSENDRDLFTRATVQISGRWVWWRVSILMDPCCIPWQLCSGK